MRGHVEHWQALARGPEPCGRKLDFLLQEMNREINTIGSKVEGARAHRNGHRGQGRARAAPRAGAECRVARPVAACCSWCRRRRARARRPSSSGWSRSARIWRGRGRTRRGRPGRASRTASTIILLTAPAFEAMVARDGFLEWADVFGNLYGTGRQETERRWRAGVDLVLVIDVQGARQVRARMPERGRHLPAAAVVRDSREPAARPLPGRGAGPSGGGCDGRAGRSRRGRRIRLRRRERRTRRGASARCAPS